MKTLIVDDFLPIANIWKTLLTSQGFNDITILTDGALVVDYVIAMKPELILMDINLSDSMSGLEITEEILKILPTAKVLIISMHHQPIYVESARKAGAKGYFPKQGSIDEFNKKVKLITEGGMAF